MRPIAITACLLALLCVATACGKYGPPVRAGEGRAAEEAREALEPDPDEESGVTSP